MKLYVTGMKSIGFYLNEKNGWILSDKNTNYINGTKKTIINRQLVVTTVIVRLINYGNRKR